MTIQRWEVSGRTAVISLLLLIFKDGDKKI